MHDRVRCGAEGERRGDHLGTWFRVCRYRNLLRRREYVDLVIVPDDITREISLTPWHTRSPGNIRSASGAFETGLWSFSGVGEDATRVREWENLEDDVLNLLPHLVDRYQPPASVRRAWLESRNIDLRLTA